MSVGLAVIGDTCGVVIFVSADVVAVVVVLPTGGFGVLVIIGIGDNLIHVLKRTFWFGQ